MIKCLKSDVIIVGSGVSGLYCALNLPADKKITVITKKTKPESDSFLAQGGICVLRDSEDYASFFEDTMRAGHYENNPQSVELMINSSREVINSLQGFGVCFEADGASLKYTREGAHSKPRILFHKDETGKEITSKLLTAAEKRDNIELFENFTMVDILCDGNICYGIAGISDTGEFFKLYADYTVLATGGIGGLFEHSTNYRHLTGDALAIAARHGVELQNLDYIQIHPTTLYTEDGGRAFLISESVRGEGAILLNKYGERFVDELLPRDLVTQAIFAEMKKTDSKFVWLSLEKISEKEIKGHFPNIYERCLSEGYDITREPIPVVPSQHYFMGGIRVNENSKTTAERLYAVGETACNGVHGKNRLASNSLLESLVFAKRAAADIKENYSKPDYTPSFKLCPEAYKNYKAEYKSEILKLIESEKNKK